jgi:hypothetical protein
MSNLDGGGIMMKSMRRKVFRLIFLLEAFSCSLSYEAAQGLALKHALTFND